MMVYKMLAAWTHVFGYVQAASTVLAGKDANAKLKEAGQAILHDSQVENGYNKFTIAKGSNLSECVFEFTYAGSPFWTVVNPIPPFKKSMQVAFINDVPVKEISLAGDSESADATKYLTNLAEREHVTIVLRRADHANVIHEDPFTKAKVYCGNIQAAQDRKYLQERNISHIVNCQEATSENFHEGDDNFKYVRVDVASQMFSLEKPNYSTSSVFKQPFHFIDDALQAGQNVLIHCYAGAHRAGSTSIAYIMYKKKLSSVEATKFAQRQRSCIDPIMGLENLLKKFDQEMKDCEYNLNSEKYLTLYDGNQIDQDDDDDIEVDLSPPARSPRAKQYYENKKSASISRGADQMNFANFNKDSDKKERVVVKAQGYPSDGEDGFLVAGANDLKIIKVEEGKWAEDVLGNYIGWCVVKVNDVSVSNFTNIYAELAKLTPADTVEISLERSVSPSTLQNRLKKIQIAGGSRSKWVTDGSSSKGNPKDEDDGTALLRTDKYNATNAEWTMSI